MQERTDQRGLFFEYLDAGKKAKAKKNYTEAINYLKQAASTQQVSSIYQEIGHTLALRSQHNASDIDLEEAEKYLNHAIKLDPTCSKNYNILGAILTNKGDFKKAENNFLKSLSLNAKDVSAYEGLTKIKKFDNIDTTTVNLINLINSTSLPLDDLVTAYFSLGKILTDCKEYSKAFTTYKKANDLQKQKTAFDLEPIKFRFNSYKSNFTKQFLKQKKSLGHPSKTNIFIVGMPRSGTTLTEQIIASHSKVFGSGETNYLSPLVEKIMDRISPIENIKKEEIYSLANTYLKSATKNIGNKHKITTKTPGYFLYLGILNLLFPKSTFIYCKRHPLDICLSIYFNDLQQIGYSCDLSQLIEYYKLYTTTMEHWHKQLPTTIHEIYYEDLVLNQKEKSRELIKFCGLKWEDQCLEFYKKDRAIHTASTWQVRQKLYTDSIYKWKNYDKFLSPLKEALRNEIVQYEEKIHNNLK